MAKSLSLSLSLSKRKQWEIDYRDAVREYGVGYVEVSLRRGIGSCMDRLMEHTMDCTAVEYRSCVTALTDMLLLRSLYFTYEAARASSAAAI
jgi:hypothetical protein